MKQFLITLVLMSFMGSSFAQLNMSLRSNVTYNTALSDIWGWKDEVSGIEYALVGLQNGVSIVSLEDPDNAQIVQFIPGASSSWRDLKTYKDFLYVSNETGNGLAVIDLSQLPDAAPAYNWEPDLPSIGGVLTSIHNLYVDEEEGLLFIAGSQLNNGGNLIVDVKTDPANPVFLAAAPPVYAHDVYVKDNIMYSSQLNNGMGIYDISDIYNIQLLATQPTPFNFTHNIWTNDDSSVAFTTDERGNAPVAAYDISDLNNIEELDQYAPIETLGDGVIPHNVHVWENWLVISYYSDGGIIVDASRPENLIEVGNFDTFFGAGTGFSGAWGLYPFLPSGMVLVSDIGNGLYVLDANYVRACWLEGNVTDATNGAALNGVSVHIDSEQANLTTTDPSGNYESGQAIPGEFEVTYSKVGYISKTIMTTLENGVVTMEDVELTPAVTFTISGTTINAIDGTPVPNATVNMLSDIIDYALVSDADGTFTISVLQGDYEIYAGAWGYEQVYIAGQNVSADTPLAIELTGGVYEDDFVLDLGWTTAIDGATAGLWERGEPIGTDLNGSLSNPELDISTDLGDQAYITGNGGGSAGADDVDDGNVILTSPVMDFSTYTNPTINFSLWFFNRGGFNNPNPNDQLDIKISNGVDEIILETITTSLSLWRPKTIELEDFIEFTDQMTISFVVGDQNPGHIVEAGIDGFSVTDTPSSLDQVDPETLAIKAFPNPFSDKIILNFDLNSFDNNAQLNVYNALGQLVQQLPIDQTQTSIELGHTLTKGIYFVELLSEHKVSQSIRIVKE